MGQKDVNQLDPEAVDEVLSYSNVMLLKPIYFEFIYYLYLNELICRSLFRVFNKKLEHDYNMTN